MLDLELHNNLFSSILGIKPAAGSFSDFDMRKNVFFHYFPCLGVYFGMKSQPHPDLLQLKH